MSKKYRLPRKALTNAEAKSKKEMLNVQIENLLEEILYWSFRRGKPLEPIDNFIIMSDKTVNNMDEIIERNYDQIAQKNYVIENYVNLYL